MSAEEVTDSSALTLPQVILNLTLPADPCQIVSYVYACRLNFNVGFPQLKRVTPKFTHQIYDIVVGLTGDTAADGVV